MTTDNTQIENALTRLFDEEQQRIVFWNDPEREFLNTLPFLCLPEDVNILKLEEVKSFEAKIRIEQEDPTGRYLLYSPTEEPDYDDDWLLDIRLYSRSFRADRASIILDQLGLANQHLREHLAARRKFFDNKERLKRVQPLVTPGDTDADLDRKMIAVTVKADQPEWFIIIRTLYHEFLEPGNGNDIDLDNPPEVWTQVEKFDLHLPFWQMAKTLFGYEEVVPGLRNFLIRLLVTDFAAHLKGQMPESLAHLVLPQSGKSNAVVCLAQWRDSNSKGSSYDGLSVVVADILKLPDQLYKQEMGDLIDVMTFLDAEKAIVSQLRDRVRATAESIQADAIREIAARRQDGHWVSPNVAGSPDVPRKALHALYDALVAAADFFDLRSHYPQAFQY
ncbi:MAG: BREX-1 system phosphatase PglZ type A, partial [Planctomycetes bacterium]|nr:BREX-1 system phosphatase PglZ type A [Planctomycetota bacterium]